ncbi:Monooxygenase FAD-binding protein [Lasiodiplodia theobromae]|nr:Monooxygenase FAD-binding protein [Lasiodiplodia theobromae]
MALPNIAIIGAGPAGLTLARLLQVHNIPCTVFEKDPTPSDRATNGGCLDLHVGSGQEAVKEAGLWDAYQKYARYSGQAYIISDSTGREYLNIRDLDLGRPEIDRPHLRRMLLDSLRPGTVRWDHKLSSVTEGNTATTGPTLHFASGRVESGFDLVVGADGAWSKVRERLCTVPPFYAGLCGYEMWITDDPDAACPDVSALTGDGSHWAVGQDGRMLSLQRQTDRSIQIYALMRKHEAWHANSGIVDPADPTEVKDVILHEYADWAPQFRRAIEAVDGAVIPRSLYMLHVGTRWRHKAGLTLIGDAAHLMTPFAGEGVNVAMHDALLLARSIIGRPWDQVDAAAEEYERDMFPRAKVFQQATWDSLQARFDDDGNEKMAEGFKKVAEELKNGSYVNDGSRPDAVFTS